MTQRLSRQPSPFGVLLLRYRTAARLTQEQLSAAAGLSPDAVAALERGKRSTPRASTVELLADALGLSEAERAELRLAAHAPVPLLMAASEPALATARAVNTERVIADPQLPPTPDVVRLPVAQPSPLVGRETELTTIIQRLTVEGVRLLTLVGPAGVGKTQLAFTVAAMARVAERFPDGVVIVDLTPVRDPQQVLGAIAHALGFTDTSASSASSASSGEQALRARLEAFLRERAALLLVLDNFEQVLPAASQLTALLTACPGLRLLVTSRVPLRSRWEQTLRIAPLMVPNLGAALPPPEVLGTIPAVELFVGRAQAHRADFTLTEACAPLVARLVTQLDGLPLALKLAAAQVDVLPLATIVKRLAGRLQALRWEAQDLPERQQSLEAALGWSYELLSPQEQRLFRHLGVFVGRVTAEAIASVMAAQPRVADASAEQVGMQAATGWQMDETLDLLVLLAEKSLILPGWLNPTSDQFDDRDADDEERELAFATLETVREYAWQQLDEAGELGAARRAHAHYFLALAEHADLQLRGPDQRVWYLRLEREHDNLRAALRWLFEQDDPAEHAAALRLAAALGWFWVIRGYPVEGGRWLEAALSRLQTESIDEEYSTALRFRLLLEAGSALLLQGDFARAQVLQQEALALAQQRQDPPAIAMALTYLGTWAVYASEPSEALRLLGEARVHWETMDNPFFLGLTLNFLGSAVLAQADQQEAAALKAAAVAQLEAAGAWGFAGTAHLALASIVGREGNMPQAIRHMQAALEASLAMRDRRLLSSGVRATLAAVLVSKQVDPARRIRLLGAADSLTQATSGTVVSEREPAYRAVARLREQLERGEWLVAYREGRCLPFGEIVAMALSMLNDVAQALPARDHASEAPDQHEVSARPPGILSTREHEVLQLVAQGLSSKAIGQRLFLAPTTVNQHVKSIFNKLGVDTRAQAVAVASQRGLL